MSEHPGAAIIGAGTGLGASHRVWLNEQYYIFPSETGHVGFTPENDLQSRLLVWLQKKYPHVSLEMVLSGRGIYTIYKYLKEKEKYPESEFVKKAKLTRRNHHPQNKRNH